MVDNTLLNSGTGGDTIATDDIGGIKFPRSKLVLGDDNTNDGDVSTANPMPVDTHNVVDTGALGALNNEVTLATPFGDAVTWEIDTGTLVGTVSFEATLDDTNFFAIDAIQIDGTIITSTTSFPDRGHLTSTGYSQVRLRVSAYTSGTSNARIEGSVGTDVVRLGDSLPAGDNNIGNVDIVSLPDEGQQTMANSISIAVASDQSVISVDDNAGSITVDAPVATPVNAQLSDGTDTALVTAAGELNVIATAQAGVDIGDVTINNASGASAVNIQDGGNTITVDGTVTADAGTGDFLSVTGHTRNEAFKESTAIGGELDDTAPVAATEGNVSPARITAQRALHANLRNNAGTETGTAGEPLRVDPTGSTTQPVSGTVTANAGTGIFTIDEGANALEVVGDVAEGAAVAGNPVQIGLDDGTNVVRAQGTAAGDLKVTLDSETVALAAGTNTNEVVGDVAADAATAGNPVLIGVQAETMADAAPSTRVSADGDASYLAADRDGAAYVHPHGPQIWSYHEDSSSALTDASVHTAPGAGLSLYVTDIVFSTGAATALNFFFEESTTTVLGPYYLEAVAGRGMSLHLQTPKKITANTALTITSSAAIAHGVDVTGFIAPG